MTGEYNTFPPRDKFRGGNNDIQKELILLY